MIISSPFANCQKVARNFFEGGGGEREGKRKRGRGRGRANLKKDVNLTYQSFLRSTIASESAINSD
jgi:hypothetical protein